MLNCGNPSNPGTGADQANGVIFPSSQIPNLAVKALSVAAQTESFTNSLEQKSRLFCCRRDHRPITPQNFEINQEFLYLIGLLKSGFIECSDKYQLPLLLESINNPKILARFNQFYKHEMNKELLHHWISTLDTLEKKPTFPKYFMTNERTGTKATFKEVIPALTKNFEAKGEQLKAKTIDLDDFITLFTDNAVLTKYREFAESSDHLYTVQELINLHQFMVWFRHHAKSAKENPELSMQILDQWIHLAEENPGKLCQYCITRAICLSQMT